MKRRLFVAGAAGGAAAATAGSIAAPAIAQDTIRWTMVSPWPKGAPGVGVNAQRVADRINEMSGGRLEVTHFAAGELVPPFESLDAVQSGDAHIMHATPYYWVGRSPALNFFTGVPYGLTATELSGWLEFGDGQELWDEVYADFGVKAFYAGSSGTQAGGWFRQEINTLDDIQGLRIRIAGLGGEVFRRLGAAVTMLPPGEIFAAMEAGTVDAAEWVGPWNDLAFGFYRIAKNYYYPGFHEPGPTLSLGVNLAAYEELSTADKAVIENAALAENSFNYAEFMAKNGQALSTLVEQHGVELKRFPAEVFDAFARASEETAQEAAEHDDLSRRIYDSYIKARKSYSAWTEVSEQAYAIERNRALDL